MKKVILVILIVAIFTIATGCTESHQVKDGKEMYCGFVLIENMNNTTHICYDPETNICYVIVWNKDTYGYGFSPYYILKNGEPVIAVYGKNYKIEKSNTFGDK